MAWTDEHDTALRKYLNNKLSFTQASAAINADFATSYSRNAAIGRANRLGIKSRCPKHAGERRVMRRAAPKAIQPKPTRIVREFARDELTGLRVAEVIPLHLTLTELELQQCRWPYGDGPFTFCGCPRFGEGAYCEPHDALAGRYYQAAEAVA